ncbi:AVID protein, partial [Smithornis capensis]|nr:AVID protein [Smithornis capensis]
MVQATLLLLVLSLALGAHGLPEEKCSNLTGEWKNDLGSNMTISVDEEGNFTGLYNTAVASATNPIQTSPLRGSQHLQDKTTFGFTVNWTFSDSTTVFTGQCFMDKGGNEVLKTMWLLRSHVEDIENDWKATR